MNKILAILLAGVAAMGTAVAADGTEATRSAVDKAAADYKSAKAQCDSLKSNAKTICVDEAKAARAHAEADAMAQDTTISQRARTKAQVAAVDADYALARAQCNDKKGNDKTTCIDSAKAGHTVALNDAKNPRPMANTTTTPTATERAGNAMDNAGQKASDATARAGVAVADTAITTRVKADLVKERDLSSTGIHVETVKGTVMLSGFVNSKAEADRAVEVARSVDGVKKVESAIKVK
jgi:hyperosmotically inducible protein